MKKYAFLAMLLIGLLVPMTIASKSVDFQVNTVLFDNQEVGLSVDVLKLTQPQITKFMITKEVAEGIQKRRFTESKVVIYLTAFPPSDISISRDSYLEYVDKTVRCQVDSMKNDIHRYAVTNYIRYL